MKAESFIRTWTILDHKSCDGIVDYFWDNKKEHIDGGTVEASNKFAMNSKKKESTDLGVRLQNVYEVPCFKSYEQHLRKCVLDYIKEFPSINELCQFGLLAPFNIQYYKPGGGYKVEHFERSGFLDSSIQRGFVFMTYLNDVPDGGTIFKYFDHTETAVKGKTVIWPSDWTHTHVGQITKKNEKYIITGWLTYNWNN
jgi:prolyl 4-hydroxylase